MGGGGVPSLKVGGSEPQRKRVQELKEHKGARKERNATWKKGVKLCGKEKLELIAKEKMAWQRKKTRNLSSFPYHGRLSRCGLLLLLGRYPRGGIRRGVVVPSTPSAPSRQRLLQGVLLHLRHLHALGALAAAVSVAVRAWKGLRNERGTLIIIVLTLTKLCETLHYFELSLNIR